MVQPRIPLATLEQLVVARLLAAVGATIKVYDIGEDPPSAEPSSPDAPGVARWCRLADLTPVSRPRRMNEGDAHQQAVAITVTVGVATPVVRNTPTQPQLDAEAVAAALDGQTLRTDGVSLLIHTADIDRRARGEFAGHQVLVVSAIGDAQRHA